jgi:hypothetical protein
MKRLTTRLLVALTTGGALVNAQEFSFTVRNMTSQEARSCPGGSGAYAMVMTKVPAIKQAPKALSAKPLFGQTQMRASGQAGSSSQLLIFLDESKGTGQGYDRLVLDLNGNGDLTDDPVFERSSEGPRGSNPGYEQAVFGPIELPADKVQGIWRPRLYAEMYLYNKGELSNYDTTQPRQIGQLRLQAGNYLETTVEVNGVKQKFGVVDGNCNFRIGDSVTIHKIMRRAGDPGSWYMSSGDFYLRDRNNSGQFERTATGTDAEMYSSLIYFGGKPFSTQLAADLKSIKFEPFSGPVGELVSKGKLSDLIMGWEKAKDQWEALAPDMVDGKAVVPTGSYRISSCSVGAKKPDGGWVKAQSSEVPDKTIAVEAGKATTLEYGLPLALEVTANKQRADQSGSSGIMGAARALFGSSTSSSQDWMLRMDLKIAGAAGEKYSGFSSSDGSAVSPPRFQVVDAAGKEVATGNFEFG